MVDKTKVSSEVFEMLQMMNKTSEELFQLLDNLLKWVRNRLNKQKIFKQESDINAIIRSTVDLFVPVAAQKHITIKKEGFEQSLTAFFDVDMVQTIVRNIMNTSLALNDCSCTNKTNTCKDLCCNSSWISIQKIGIRLRNPY